MKRQKYYLKSLWLLALLMVAGTVSAQVAKIGSQTYNSLAEAVEAAGPDQTIELLETYTGYPNAWKTTCKETLPTAEEGKMLAAYTFQAFDPKGEGETAELEKAQTEAADYLNWKVDFVVTFDKAVAANSVQLWGNYSTFGWIKIPANVDIAANQPVRLFKDGFGSDATLNYSDMLVFVKKFHCGVENLSAENEGTNCNVELHAYQVDEDGNETGKSILFNKVKYDMPAPDAIPVAQIGANKYTSLSQAVEAASGDDTIELLSTYTGYPNAWQKTPCAVELPAASGMKASDTYTFYAYDPETSNIESEVTAALAQTEAYSDWHMDWAISFDQDITANGAQLWGNYGSFGWVKVPATQSIPAGTPVRLMQDGFGGDVKLTYEELLQNVKAFHCGIENLDMANKDAKATVELRAYQVVNGEETGVSILFNKVEYTLPEPNLVPVAKIGETTYNTLDAAVAAAHELGGSQTIELLSTYTGYPNAWKQDYTSTLPSTNMEKAYTFYSYDPETANVEAEIAEALASTGSYQDWHADWVVSFDKPIAGSSAKLWGNFGTYGWLGKESPLSIPANTEIRLMKDGFGGDVTLNYADLLNSVREFHCGVENLDANNTTGNANVELRLYEVIDGAETGVSILFNKVEYTLPEPTIPVAKIGETTYNSLASAVSAASGDDTIELLDTYTGYPNAWQKNPCAVELPAGTGMKAEDTYTFYAYNPEATSTDAIANEIAVALAQTETYSNWHMDWAISFDQDITANGAQLWGNYGSFGWVKVPAAQSIPAGTQVRLMQDGFGGDVKLTYEELLQNVKAFHCGIENLDMANKDAKATVELRAYQVVNGEETGVSILFNKVEYILPEPSDNVAIIYTNEGPVLYKTLDAAVEAAHEMKAAGAENVTIELLDTYTGYPYAWKEAYTGELPADQSLKADGAYSFHALDPASTKTEEQEIATALEQAEKYKKWHADWVVTFDNEIKEESAAFWGRYSAFSDDWYDIDAPDDIAANYPVRLMKDGFGSDASLTYEDLVKTVKTFDCGIANDDKINKDTNADVELRIYEVDAEGNETGISILFDKVSYTLPDVEYVATIYDTTEGRDVTLRGYDKADGPNIMSIVKPGKEILFSDIIGKITEANMLKQVGSEYVCDNFELDDFVGWYSPVDFTAKDGHYDRTCASSGINTVCLPFELNSSNLDGGVAYSFSGVSTDEDKDNATFVETESVPAGTPCIVKHSASKSWRVYFEDTHVSCTLGTASTIVGSYNESLIGEGHYKVSGGSLVTTTVDSHVYPFRAYFDLPSNSKSFSMVFVDDDIATGLNSIKLENVAGGDIYDLSGARMSALKKGVNIVKMSDGNIKKIIKK